MRQIQETYGGTEQVRLEFKNFAFLSEGSTWAAEAVLCAADQGQFWPYHDMLFENQGQFSKGSLKRYAAALDLETGVFDDCLDGGKHRQEVQDQLVEGRAKGVESTPTVFVNETKIVGARPFETFQELIERELEREGGEG